MSQIPDYPRETAWDVWCPHCQAYHYYWGWRAEGKASEYKPVRVCLRTGKDVHDE